MAGQPGRSGGTRKGAGRHLSKVTLRDGDKVTVLDHRTKNGGRGVVGVSKEGVIVIIIGDDEKNSISIGPA